MIIYKLNYLALIPDRSDIMNNTKDQGSKLPAFTDVKMFIDSLLIGYQTNTNIEYELERTPMILTPFRRSLILGMMRLI